MRYESNIKHIKVPGTGFNVQTANMDFHYSEFIDGKLITAYERLLLDSMMGDSTLYIRGDAVEHAWEFVKPILMPGKISPIFRFMVTKLEPGALNMPTH